MKRIRSNDTFAQENALETPTSRTSFSQLIVPFSLCVGCFFSSCRAGNGSNGSEIGVMEQHSLVVDLSDASVPSSLYTCKVGAIRSNPLLEKKNQ